MSKNTTNYASESSVLTWLRALSTAVADVEAKLVADDETDMVPILAELLRARTLLDHVTSVARMVHAERTAHGCPIGGCSHPCTDHDWWGHGRCLVCDCPGLPRPP